MRLAAHLRLLTLILFFCFATKGHAEVLQYENQPIERFDIHIMNLGEDTGRETNAVKTRIKTRQGDFFSQMQFDNDLKTLSQDFDRIDPILKTIDGKLYIDLKIWPKPTIRTITWHGNDKIDTKSLQQELGIALCSVFDRLAFNKAFHKLKTYYVKKGFFEAQLEYTVSPDSCTNEVDILICVNEGRAGRIKDIIFQGFTCEEEDKLLDMMATKTYNLLFSWLNDQGTYNEDAIQHDHFVIQNYIQNKGYADAQVDLRIEDAGCSNRINIIITLDRGSLYTIDRLTFEGNCLFGKDCIENQFEVCEGDPYSPELLRESIRNIMDFYGRKGYIDCIVDYEPRLNCSNCTYSVHFTIEEGARYRVGLIKVLGNCSTQTNVILHETLLIPGEIFNTDKLQKTEERLRNIGYFKCVNVYAVKSDASSCLGDNYRDVHIEVEEQVTGNFGAGLGFSSVENFFGEIRITENNFNYKGFPNLFSQGYQALRGGGEYVHLSTLIGTKSRKYAISWTKPHFNDTPWVVGFDVERTYNSYISQDYEITSTGFTIHGTYMNNQFLRTGLHYRLRNTHTTLEEDNPTAEEEEAAKTGGLISAVGVSLTYDTTDHPTEATEGFRSRIEQEFAGVGGDHTYLSVGYLNSYFIPINDTDVLKFRGDTRFIVPMWGTEGQEIPIDERLFLGGDSTVRGYRPYRLGPSFGGDDPEGGMSLQLISIEYARRYHKRFEVFVFCDSGHLSFNLWHFGRMSTAVGFGCRVKIFEQGPPLMLGMGFPLNPQNSSEVKRFFFSVGGRF